MTIQENFPLSQLLWYKIGGRTRYLIEVENAEDIRRALDFIDKNRIEKVFFCGLGSNLIFTDDYFDGVVLRIVKAKPGEGDFLLVDQTLSVFGGVIMDDVIRFGFDHNLAGLDWAGGLPGTVGAGVRGNVGAFGGEIKDSVEYVDVLDKNSLGVGLRRLYRDELDFSYRNSLVKKSREMVIVNAVFKLRAVSGEDMAHARNIYHKNINYRKEHHPLEYPTCGSVFKNIIDEDKIKGIVSAWPDIEELRLTKWYGKVPMAYIVKRLGFAGYRVGDMQVSIKHTNFIVNLGNGRAHDVMKIITEIQNKVGEIFKFIPEIEAQIVL